MIIIFSIEACLKQHNLYRNKHQDTPPFEYNDKLAEQAQEYANELIKIGKLVHASARNGAGENLASRSSSSTDLIDAVVDGIDRW